MTDLLHLVSNLLRGTVPFGIILTVFLASKILDRMEDLVVLLRQINAKL